MSALLTAGIVALETGSTTGWKVGYVITIVVVLAVVALVVPILLLAHLEPLPDLNQRASKLNHHNLAMCGPRSEPQALHSARDGRVVDRLHIDGETLEQRVSDALGEHWIAD